MPSPSIRTRLRLRGPIGLLALSVLLLGITGTGCSVIEEIDKIGKDTKPAPAKAEPADALPAVPDGSNQAKLRAYYNRRPKQVEEDPDNPIVTCRLSGSTQFMRKYDCTLRGGRVVS
jgi:hypothetical protein